MDTEPELEDKPVDVVEPQQLKQLHYDYLKDVYKDANEEELINHVCNNITALPEDKLEGHPPHMPCAWLGYKPPLLSPTAPTKDHLGWRQCKYLLIIPSPARDDIAAGIGLKPGRAFAGKFLRSELAQAGISLEDVVVTHACRFALPEGINTYSQRHKNNSIPYLLADIENCNPLVIISCGSECLKSLFGKVAKLDTYRGDVMEYQGIPVVPTVSPGFFLHEYAGIDIFRSELRRAKEIVDGVYDRRDIPHDYRILKTLTEVEAFCNELKDIPISHLAFDTEFGNDYAREEYGYTLSIQVSWGAGKAAYIMLRGEKGAKIHTDDDYAKIVKLSGELIADVRYPPAGQHFRVDAEQMNRSGYNIDHRIPFAIDTMLIHHLLNGDEAAGLDHLCRKYFPQFGAYWSKLEAWLDQSKKRKKILAHGYRDIPLDILIPYSLADADLSWRLAELLSEELKKHPRLHALYWQHVSYTSQHLLDVERQGLLVDEEARSQMREYYQPIYDAYVTKLRNKINWPNFNPASKHHLMTFLFSESQYKNKTDVVASANPPIGANLLTLDPLYNTDRYPRPWIEIQQKGDEKRFTPSTKAGVIELLAIERPRIEELKWLRYISVLGKFLSTYLAPVETNEFEVVKDGAGFANNIHQDGRVRTHLSQLTDTGRYRSYRCNLQTFPKKQEDVILGAVVEHTLGVPFKEYKKRIEPTYIGEDKLEEWEQVHIPAFKTCIVAPPEHVLVEVDFKTAELFMWAYASGDNILIDILDSGRDLHSEVAAEHLSLPVYGQLAGLLEEFKKGNKAPYKAWVNDIKERFGAARTTAKAVLFGLIYGRSARALWREIKKSSPDITLEMCQAIIVGISSSYVVAWQYLCDNANKAVTDGFVESMFGRKRYFTESTRLSDQDKAAIGRQAKNMPIQSGVGDLLAKAGINFYNFRYKTKAGMDIGYKCLLPIHDAFLFEVREDKLEQMKKVIQLCMSDRNCLPGTSYKLAVDIEVYKKWGQKLSH